MLRQPPPSASPAFSLDFLKPVKSDRIYSIIGGCQPAQTQLRPTVTATPLFNLSTAQIELEVKQKVEIQALRGS